MITHLLGHHLRQVLEDGVQLHDGLDDDVDLLLPLPNKLGVVLEQQQLVRVEPPVRVGGQLDALEGVIRAGAAGATAPVVVQVGEVPLRLLLPGSDI